jgi:predicted lipid-binding transport protein (Tim44 family)
MSRVLGDNRRTLALMQQGCKRFAHRPRRPENEKDARMSEFAYADIIILALIAVFIALRLRNTLGKDIGHRPDASQLRRQFENLDTEKVVTLPGVKTDTAEADNEAAESTALERITDLPTVAVLKEIRKADTTFRIAGFIEGARGAFEWVVNAFKEGDKETLRNLMSEDVYREFEAVLDEHAKSGVKMEATLVSIVEAEITAASLQKDKARITVAFTTEQILVEREKSGGKILSGDPSHVQKVEDVWVFERDIKDRSPNWTVIDT